MSNDLEKKLDGIISRRGKTAGALVGICQDIQDRFDCIPEQAVRHVSRRLGIPASRVFAVVTFYSAFTLTRRGRNRIQVCLGTACHLKGGGHIADRVAAHLSIRPGESTRDCRYSFQTVRCLGCCALAPVVKINDTVCADVSQEQVPALLGEHR